MGIFSDDDELIYMCAKGNERAWELLYQRYHSFIGTWMNEKVTTYRYLSVSQDELKQLMIAVWYRAVEEYQPEYGIFYAYAKLCVQREMVSFLRDEMSLSGKLHRQQFSLDEPLHDMDCTTYGDLIESHYWNTNPAAEFQLQETWSTIRTVIDTQLNELEQKVFARQQAGISYEDIASELGISEKKIDNILQKIKRLLKMRLNDDQL